MLTKFFILFTKDRGGGGNIFPDYLELGEEEPIPTTTEEFSPSTPEDPSPSKIVEELLGAPWSLKKKQ